MRILLVEDDPMIADAVKSALADEAHAVDHVSSGRTALTQLGLSDYQLVLLDLGLPGLDTRPPALISPQSSTATTGPALSPRKTPIWMTVFRLRWAAPMTLKSPRSS